MKPNVFQETAAAVAKRFGVSVKALRVYEEAGLLKPARTMAGWRIYRQPEIERLSAILALKQLGLPRKRIGDLLRGGGDLAAALALQEAALEDAKSETEQALVLVRAARAKLAGKRSLSPDELGKLVRSTAVSEFKWNDKMEALAQKHYSPEQLAEIRSRGFTPEDQKRVGLAWAQIYADIDALGAKPDPTSDRAIDIGRRAQVLIQEFTRGDPALFRAAGAMNRAAMPLKICITKGATHDAVEISGAGVSASRFEFPKKGPIPHDFVHLSVEQVLGFKRGFWGMIAEGVAPGDIQEIAKAGGHASASRAETPSAAIVELIQAERIVECFEADFWGAPADNETFREIASVACAHSFVPCPALADDAIAAIRARIAAFAKDWTAAPVGQRFEFDWSA